MNNTQFFDVYFSERPVTNSYGNKEYISTDILYSDFSSLFIWNYQNGVRLIYYSYPCYCYVAIIVVIATVTLIATVTVTVAVATVTVTNM